jgi:hypothetical protein
MTVGESIRDDARESMNFFNYVFNFDDENKANMINVMQYVLMALIPVIIVLKLVKHYVPEEDDSKSSFEILAEVVGQLTVIFMSIWFIDKMIRFVPTYSQINYHKFNEVNFVLPFLVILVTMQTKLGSKINILFDRVMELWNGNSGARQAPNQSNVRVSQPIAGHHVSQADYLGNSVIPPPPQQMQVAGTTQINDLPTNHMQQQQNQHLMDIEPAAANGVLGSAFGSW